MILRLLFLIGVFATFLPGPASAQAGICDEAAQIASVETGVPQAILMAVTRTETGRTFDGVIAPWPWAGNFAGASRWFDDRADAIRAFQTAEQSGLQNFDVGCFQLNFRWHREAFASLSAMLDPMQNARHAARFLSDLHAEFGSWEAAVGAYHSRNPVHATRYLSRYNEILRSVGAVVATTAPAPGRGQVRQTTALSIAARPSLFQSAARLSAEPFERAAFIQSRARALVEGDLQ